MLKVSLWQDLLPECNKYILERFSFVLFWGNVFNYPGATSRTVTSLKINLTFFSFMGYPRSHTGDFI